MVVGSLVGYGRELSAVGCVCEISELFCDMDCKGLNGCNFSVVELSSCEATRNNSYLLEIANLEESSYKTACTVFCCNMNRVIKSVLLLSFVGSVGCFVGG